MQVFDNIHKNVKDDLTVTVAKGSKMAIAAACFSIYNRERSLYGTEFEVKLRNELSQKAIARECADWIRKKAKFMSNVTSEHMGGFLNVITANDKITYLPLPDTGFRVLKLDSSNMKDVYYTPQDMVSPSGTFQIPIDGLLDNIKSGRTAEDLLFQVMLDLGIALSSKIEQRAISGKVVFSVADNYLMACFDRATDAIVTEIAQRKPYYAVFRDSSFASDATLVNFEQIFKTYSPTTIRKVL